MCLPCEVDYCQMPMGVWDLESAAARASDPYASARRPKAQAQSCAQ
jgi:hypothetical protein